MILTPTYHVMEMYNVHQEATMLPLTIQTNQYKLDNRQLPALTCSASKNKEGITHISLTNIHAREAQEITIDLRGAKYASVNGRVLTAATLQDHNTFENPEKIKPAAYNGATLSNNQLKVKVPPFSVVVLALK